MSTRLGISITKDNAFQGNSVSSPLNSNEVKQSNSKEVAYAVAYESASGSGGVLPRAYKYNGSPNYKSNNFPLIESEKPVFTQIYGSPNYTTAAATIDYLCVTFRVILPSKDEDFKDGSWMDSSGRLGIKLVNRRVPHYRYFGRCFLDGVQFGEISFCPYKDSVLKEDFASLKMGNELFYSNEWYTYLMEFKALTNAVINNISRVDVAVDYSGAHGQKILEFVKNVKFGNSSYRKLGVKNLEYALRDGHNDSFKIGNHGANKSAVFYNKSLEIREKSGKDYITSYHRSNGLDPNADAYRFELRLRSEALKSVAGFSLEQLLDVDYLVCLVKTHTKNWFEFVPCIAVNVSRAKRYDILKLEAVSFAVTYLNRVKRQVKSNARTTKIAAKLLIEQILLDGGKQACLIDAVNLLIANSNLSDWLQYRFEAIMMDLDKKFRFICTPAISGEELARLLNVSYTAPVISRSDAA